MGADAHLRKSASPQTGTTTLLALVRAQAARTPDRPAVLGATSLTYRRLLRQADGIGGWLRGRGVRQGDAVGVARGRGGDLPGLILGIHACGAVYVPIDPLSPEPLRERIVATVQPRLVIDESEVLPDGTSEASPEGLDGAGGDLAVLRQGDDPTAYVIFTSGSTGDPKGVRLSHEGLYDYARALPARVGTTAEDRCLGLAPPGFSSSIRQLLVPLAVGAAVVVCDEDDVRTPWAFLDLLARHAVTQLDVVPSFWRALTDTQDDAELARTLVTVRRTLFASERLDAALVRRTIEVAPHSRVWNMYGCSETTGIIAACDVTALTDTPGPLPIGTGLDHVRLGVRRLDAGEELVVTGRAVAIGYLGRRNGGIEPVGAGARRLTTGDLVSRDEDGRFVWRGRADRQSKVRGFRVNHEAVEAELGRCPAIRRAAVVAADTDGLEVAYTERAGEGIEPSRLIRWAREELPPPMVPAAAHRVSSWPELPNGKTDLMRLRRLVPVRSSPAKRELEERDGD